MTDRNRRESLPPVVDELGLLPPPAELQEIELPLTSIDSQIQPLYRCHGRKYSSAAFNHSLADTRFAAPNGEFGVLYFAFDEYGAFIETFGPNLLNAQFRVISHTQR